MYIMTKPQAIECYVSILSLNAIEEKYNENTRTAGVASDIVCAILWWTRGPHDWLDF